jgi:hypothetical protein
LAIEPDRCVLILTVALRAGSRRRADTPQTPAVCEGWPRCRCRDTAAITLAQVVNAGAFTAPGTRRDEGEAARPRWQALRSCSGRARESDGQYSGPVLGTRGLGVPPFSALPNSAVGALSRRLPYYMEAWLPITGWPLSSGRAPTVWAGSSTTTRGRRPDRRLRRRQPDTGHQGDTA